MSFNQILDIAIVLIGVYATLSCVCSWINEKISKFLELRGWNLFRGIAHLVGDHDLAAQIFNHPLIATTSPDPSKAVSTASKTAAGRFADVRASKPPSYLDARNFSSAFWQTLLSSGAGIAATTAGALEGAKPDAPPPQQSAASTAGVDHAAAVVQQALNTPTALIAALQTSVTALPEPLKQQAVSLLAQAGGDYEKLLRATDGWFNAQMDRVSGWYKRQTAWFMAAIAILVVTFTGIDTLEMLQKLSTLSPVEVARAATTMEAANGVGGATPPAAVASTPVPGATSDSRAQTTPRPSPSPTPAPIPGGPVANGFDVTSFIHGAHPIDNWGNHAGGMLVTFAALLLGGPFWFDLLLQLANVRNAGRKPERDDQPPR